MLLLSRDDDQLQSLSLPFPALVAAIDVHVALLPSFVIAWASKRWPQGGKTYFHPIPNSGDMESTKH